jgi:hypothetical protein
MARMIAAHTTHGGSTAAKRAMQRYVSTLAARMRLFGAALRLRAHLPAEMAARLALGPAELKAPPRPIQGAFAANESPTTSNVRNGRRAARRERRFSRAGGAAGLVPPGRAAERLAALAEAERQAPWRRAIAFARAAKRAARVAQRAASVRATGGEARIARPNDMQRENAAEAPGLCDGGGGPVSEATAQPRSGPGSALNGATALQRELALRAAGLRARNCGQDPGDAALKPGPGSKIPEPNPMNREPAAARRLTRLTPTKAAALCSTTLAGTWKPSLQSVLTPLFARAVPSGWFVPQASRLMAATGSVWNGGCCETPKRAYET